MEVWYLFLAAMLVGTMNGISPTGITLLVLSLKNRKNIFPALGVSAAFFAVFIVFGGLVYFGLASWLQSLLPKDSTVDHVLELFLALVLFYFGVTLKVKTEDLKEMNQITFLNVFIASSTVAIIEFPLSLPYFAMLQQIHQARVSLQNTLIAILIFNVFHVVPLLAITFLSILIPDSNRWVLDWLRQKIAFLGVYLVKFVLVVLSIIGFVDGIGHLAGYPVLPF
jgi:hypothetical protein